MDGLAVLLVLLPLSAQVTPVIQGEVRFSPPPSEGPVVTERGGSLPGSLPPSVSPSPSPEPPEVDEWPPVESYLYNANATLLALANCTRAYRLPDLHGVVPAGLRSYLSPALDALTNAANFLNMIFQTNDLRESSVTEDMEWYHALVRGLLEGTPLIRRAILTFDAQPTASRPQLVLRASRTSSRSQDILLQDLSSAWELMHPPPPAPDASWFTALKFPELAQRAPSLSKRLLLNDLRTLTTPKWGRGDSYVTSPDGVRWAEAPFLECEGGRFAPDWLLTLSTSFYGLKPDLSPEFRGVIRVDVSLQNFGLDQCAKGKDWFSNSHHCNRTSMWCEPTKGHGFRLGQYTCHCKVGYYSPTASHHTRVAGHSSSHWSGPGAPVLPVCVPCWPGCAHCEDGSSCTVQEDWFLRAAVLTAQGIFILLVFISMLVTYQYRMNKRIHSSGLLLLETILFGSVLLYFPVFILYFKPSTFRCILLRWVRLLGFSIVYGTVSLKMYRVLKVFLSHTAQRVSYMSSVQLLRQLGVIILMVSWFLSAWTAGALQNRDRNVPLLVTSSTAQGQSFLSCDLDRWDYMMAFAEVLFLIWSSFLCNAVKTVPSAFHEPRYMCIAIHNELLLSSAFHLLRFSMPSLHPDRMLLLFFSHTHVTVTMTLCLLFIPKFLHVSQPLREEIAAEVYEDEVDLQCSGSYLNSSFASAWSEHAPDPSDIRDELRKLYSQMEIRKTKKMANNNPHLQKKRTSRRSVGLSIMKRIIPESMSRQASCEGKERSLVVGGSNAGSFNKNKGLESGSIKFKEDSKRSIRKSHSTCEYDHQLNSGDTKGPLVRQSLSNKHSVNSDTESMDNGPLVYKSASAHNLSSDNKLQVEPSKLQKSLSVMTKNNMSVYLHPNKTSSFEYSASIRTPSTNTIMSGSFDKIVCPWEYLPENKDDASQRSPSRTGNEDSDSDSESKPKIPVSSSAPGSPHTARKKQKERVSSCYGPPCSFNLSVKGIVRFGKASGKNKNKNGSDHTKIKGDNKQQAPVVITRTSPPQQGSDRNDSCWEVKGTKPCLVKQAAIRVPSNESLGTDMKQLKSLPGGGYISPQEKLDSEKMKRQNSIRRPSNAQNDMIKGSESTVSISAQSSPRPIQQRTPRHQISTPNISPCTVKESNVPSVKSVRSASVGIKDMVTLLRQRGSLANVCPWEVQEETPDNQDNKIQTSKNMFATVMLASKKMKERDPSFKKEVCPWDIPEDQTPQRQPGIAADVCPWDVPEPNNQTPQRQPGSAAAVCPWDVPETSSQTPQKQAGIAADVCPWDVPETSSQTSQKQPSIAADVCPWDAPEPNNQTPQRQPGIAAAVCPWDAPEPNNQTPQKQPGIAAAVCPWDVPETSSQTSQKQPSIAADVCPWDAPEPNNQTPQKQPGIAADVCPWDVPETSSQTSQKQPSIAADVCPWDAPEPNNQTPQKQPGIAAAVCPWDAPEPNNQTPQKCKETPQRQPGIAAAVCPWDVPEPANQTPQKQPSIAASVCPWDAPEPNIQTPQKQPGIAASVCPWDAPEPNNQTPQKQPSIAADVCPWDVPEPTNQTPQKQPSIAASVCPWDAPEPNNQTPQKQPSIAADVCPWDAPETSSQTSQKQPSIAADVCPWDAPEPNNQTPQKQPGIAASVCPWDVPEPNNQTPQKCKETPQRQPSIAADVCPWDAPEPNNQTPQKQPSIAADVCPWDVPEPANQTPQKCKETPQKQPSIAADVCPWDVGENNRSLEKQSSVSSSLKSMNGTEKNKHQPKSGHEDICPWEQEETQTAERKESVKSKQSRISTDMCQPQALPNKVDICPWETEGANERTEKQEHISANICPWEAQSPEGIMMESGSLAEVCPWEGKEQEKANQQENVDADVCPWESKEVRSEPVALPTTTQSSDREETGTKAPEPSKTEINSNPPIASLSQKTDGDKSSPVSSCRDAALPCETQEVKPPLLDKKDDKSDMTPWECEDTGGDDAESAAEAFFFPPDL